MIDQREEVRDDSSCKYVSSHHGYEKSLAHCLMKQAKARWRRKTQTWEDRTFSQATISRGGRIAPRRKMGVYIWMVLLQAVLSHAQELSFPCPLSLLIPFTDRRSVDVTEDEDYTPSIVTTEDHERDGIALLATAFLAIQDFNRRESSLVPMLSSYQECQIFFPETPILLDTARSPERIRATRDKWLTLSSCAVMGPMDNHATQTVASELVGTIVPAISYGAQAPLLANASFFPNLALGNVQWANVVSKVCHYALAQRRYSVGVLYTPGDNLDPFDYVQVWEAAQDDTGLIIQLALIWNRSRQEFETRLSGFKSQGYTTIIVALRRDDNLALLAEVADGLGMLSEEYLWIFLDSYLAPQSVQSFDASGLLPVQKMLDGVRIFQLLDGLVPVETHFETGDSNVTKATNRFKEEWQNRGSDMVDELNLFLTQSDGLMEDMTITIGKKFFEENSAAYRSGYLYDAILSMGMSACDGISPLDLEHQGPSGIYRFVNRSLDVKELEFGVFFVALDESGYFDVFLQDITSFGEWNEIPSDAMNDNYHQDWASALAITLGSLAIVYALASCYFVFHFRKNRIVSVGQPEFLYMVCCGATIIAFETILMAFEVDNGWSQKRLDRVCVAQMWFGYLGLLIVYMALFSKLWRVEKVTQMRRRQRIEVRHVIAPFVATVTAAIIFLFVCTFVDPPTWTREPLASDLSNESAYGRCQPSLWFDVGLDVLLTFAVVLSVWQAHKTKDLPEDISDSKRVWQTLTAHLMILIIGFLFVLIASLNENEIFYHCSVVLMSFFGSISSVFFLVAPKMFYIYRFKKTGELPAGLQRGRTQVSGLILPGRVGPSSRFTLNQADTPPSMVASGISGTSGVSSVSQSESGSRSMGGFLPFRSLGSNNKGKSRRSFGNGTSSKNLNGSSASPPESNSNSPSQALPSPQRASMSRIPVPPDSIKIIPQNNSTSEAFVLKTSVVNPMQSSETSLQLSAVFRVDATGSIQDLSSSQVNSSPEHSPTNDADKSFRQDQEISPKTPRDDDQGADGRNI